MTTDIQAFFLALGARRYEPLLHSASGTIQWEIEGEEVWSVSINQGIITLPRDPLVPETTISCRKETFLALAKGVQNPLTAFLQGTMAVKGNIALALVFQRVFQCSSHTNTPTTRTGEYNE